MIRRMHILLVVGSYIIVNIVTCPLYGQDPKLNKINALQEKLRSKNHHIRLTVLKELIKTLPEKRIRKILMDYYIALPKKRQRGKATESERSFILKALVKDEPAGSEEFVMKVLDEELHGIREREKYEEGIYYPANVMQVLYKLIPEYYLNSQLIQEKIHSAAVDKGVPFTLKLSNGSEYSRIVKLPFTIRQNLAGVDIAYEVHNMKNINSKVDYIVGYVIPFPICSIPYEIYQNQAKRIAYGNTEKFKKQTKLLGRILRSDKGIKAFGAELALEHLGRKIVSHLLQLIQVGGFEKEKKDVLMRIIAQIMLNHLKEEKRYSNEDKAVLVIIRNYVSKMQSKGFGDSKDRLEGVLSNIEQAKKKYASGIQ